MGKGCAVVLDVGKRLTKLTLWSSDGRLVDRCSRPNVPQCAGPYPALDVQAIAEWLAATLTRFAKQGEIAAIVPVAHGAAAVVLTEDGGWLPPIDYEAGTRSLCDHRLALPAGRTQSRGATPLAGRARAGQSAARPHRDLAAVLGLDAQRRRGNRGLEPRQPHRSLVPGEGMRLTAGAGARLAQGRGRNRVRAIRAKR